MENKTPGQKVCEAFEAHRVNWAGARAYLTPGALPQNPKSIIRNYPWESLSEEEKADWEAAAAAVME